MKAKVAHLFKKLEEIERDTVELKKLTDRISDDREYSPILKESFLSEMHKLEEQKVDILRVTVTQVPQSLSQKSELQSLESQPLPVTEISPNLDKKKPEKQIRKY